ncbi:hypothetical protein [Capnocytophaga canis]|nr:hypothetical protein [Capnocytophaga canis]
MSFFYAGKRTMYLYPVHNTDYAINWINSKGIQWDTAKVYHRRTRQLLEVYENPLISFYSLTFVDYYPKVRTLHLPSVPNVSEAVEWALSKGIKFKYVNVYSRDTKVFLERIYL